MIRKGQQKQEMGIVSGIDLFNICFPWLLTPNAIRGDGWYGKGIIQDLEVLKCVSILIWSFMSGYQFF
jgi:hypothetical protein